MIASGVVRHETKLFLVAQRRGIQSANKTSRSSSVKKTISRCLCEISFDSEHKKMNVELRCADKSQIAFFMSALALKELI